MDLDNIRKLSINNARLLWSDSLSADRAPETWKAREEIEVVRKADREAIIVRIRRDMVEDNSWSPIVAIDLWVYLYGM